MRRDSSDTGIGSTPEVSASWGAVPVADRGTIGEEGLVGEGAFVGQSGVADRTRITGPARRRSDRGRHEPIGTRHIKLRGSRVGMRRDALFRRMLLAADVVAVVGAFQLTVLLSARSLQLTWTSIAGVPILLVGAKILGLYDRDEMLLRKTTLDEAPKLFQVATLCALVAWLAGGLVLNGTLHRPELLFLWLALFVLLILSRTVARALALRIVPPERCLFIGEASAAKTICSKLTGHGGVKAEVVAQLDADEVAFWTADALSADRLLEIRDLAQALDVHRAIIAPGRTDSGEMLDLVRTLKAVGVRVSVLPRVLEVVGSSVEFDDLHGVTMMGVRRFELTRSSAAVKRAFDVLGASVALAAVGPLMALIALAIKLDSRGPMFFRQLRVGRTASASAFQVQDDGLRRGRAQGVAARSQRSPGGALQDRGGPACHTGGPDPAQVRARRAPAALRCAQGRDEHRRTAPARRRRGRAHPWLVSHAPGAHAGHDRPLADPRPGARSLQEMVAIDYLYVANWSLWGDIKIMLRTVPHVVGRRRL